MGNCRFRLFLTGEMAQKWRHSWKLINEQRMARNRWSFLGSSADTDPRSVAQRNHGRPRRRYLRAGSPAPHQGLDVREDGRHMVEPSDDGDAPVDPPGNPRTLPTLCSLPLASRDPRLTIQVDAPSAKRPGDPSDSGSNKEKRAEQDPEETGLGVDPTGYVAASGWSITEQCR